METITEANSEERMVTDELVNDDGGSKPGPSEEEERPVMWPKIPFSDRINPMLSAKDKQLENIEDYFAYLLCSPVMTLKEILDGNFDELEIDAIMPGGPDWATPWQRSNAKRYYLNLKSRFSGHTPTLAFKLALLYFGFPVEPLRPDELVPYPVKLGFGEDIEDEEVEENEVVEEDEAAREEEAAAEGGVAEKDEAEERESLETSEDKTEELADGANNLGLRGGGVAGAVEEISPEGYDMGVEWSDELEDTTGEGSGEGGETVDEGSYAALDALFMHSGNTLGDAARRRILRDRSFKTPTSIFTNPLKPVMPLYGPPLESIIKTGPGVPGVSIAMMTPTEMLRLQREVHSLRSQLLDRTRECPYLDCDQYFTYSDGDGLDRHVREEHNILRCFLCPKEANLLPYYNLDKIKDHFVREHVNDILETYGISVADSAMLWPPESGDEGTLRVVRKKLNQQKFEQQLRERELQQEEYNLAVAKQQFEEEKARLQEELFEQQDKSGSEKSDVSVRTRIERQHSKWRKLLTKDGPKGDNLIESLLASFPKETLDEDWQEKLWDKLLQNPKLKKAREEAVRLFRDLRTEFSEGDEEEDEDEDEDEDDYTPPPAADIADDSDPDSNTAEAGVEAEQEPAITTKPTSKRKRKRPADLDTFYSRPGNPDEDEAYEYSEKSAVFDPLENIDPDAPPSPKRFAHNQNHNHNHHHDKSQEIATAATAVAVPATTTTTPTTKSPGGKKTKGTKKTTAAADKSAPVVTRTGRTVRASRAARGES